MTERGVIYGRASRDVNHTGTSVQKQIERGELWASGEDIELLEPIRDPNMGATRGSKERPGFKKVRGLIERQEIDVLILWEVSRSTRDAAESMSLLDAAEDNHVDLVVDGKRYDPSDDADRIQLQFMFVMADSEGRRTKKRNIDSVTINARRGTPHGRLPYGYRRIYDSTNGVLLEQTPYDENGRLLPEAQVLVDAARDVLAGVPIRRVCKQLNERGVPSPRKPRKKTLQENPDDVVTVWERATLRQLLLNPTIAGRRVYRGEDIGPAQWEPIVAYDEWLRLKSLLSDPSRLTVAVARGPSPRHLLTGIAKCGVCGSRLKASVNMRGLKKAYVCRHEGCMKVTVTGEKVDAMIDATVLALFATPGFRGSLASAYRERSESQANGADIGARIADLETERDELEAMRAQVPPAISLRAYAAEDQRIEKALDELRASEVAMVTSPTLQRMLRASDLEERWAAADLMDRREVIRILLEITINRPTRNTGRRFDPNRVVVAPSDFLRDDVLQGKPLGAKS
ncbi:recombinase family protein [Brevibacterium sp. 'Marine']|uniref:recombinase family protein n=1 Tax=Brevibacterium sp. 'Marine' TaxID=2725563 RepID=UPI00145C89B5|nr:recombinase family protein [Brevibacterium sp. 'Marine']